MSRVMTPRASVAAWAFALGLAGLATAAQAEDAPAGEVCHEVMANAGWQDVAFPVGMVVAVRHEGAWRLADGPHPAVSGAGHFGEAAEALEAQGAPRHDPSSAHGALLFEVSANGRSHQGNWAQFKSMLDEVGPFRMNGGGLRFRINETDAALADNSGALTVCMRYSG